MADVSGELAPFAAILSDATTRDLARRTLEWVREHQVFEGDRLPNSARLVVVASVFARLCAPSGATLRQYDVAARFTLLFFYIDDAPAEELPSLLGGAEPWSVGRLTPSMRDFLAEFREMSACAPALKDENLARSYHDYLRARRDEIAHKRRPLSVAEHWAFRRRTIFMDPYIDHWMILIDIDPTQFALDSFTEARRIATDIVLLSNDLGSVERDTPDGQSPDDLNLIDAYIAERGSNRKDTVEHLIQVQNEMVAEVRAALQSAAMVSGAPPAFAYADLLTGIIDGNVGSMRALRFRYPGIAETLRRLATVV